MAGQMLLCALLPPAIVTTATFVTPRPVVMPHRAAIGMASYAEDGAPRMWLARLPEASLELREAKAALAVFTSCAVGVWRASLAVTRLAALQAALAARAATAALVAQVSLAQAVAIALSPRARGRVATAAQPAAGEAAVEVPEDVPADVDLPSWSSSTDPLTLLGVTYDASTAQLKEALRERARLFHPDRHLAHTRVYEELFSRITSAYEQLCADANECAVIEPHAASYSTAVAEPTTETTEEPEYHAMYTDTMFHEPVTGPFAMYVKQPTATPEASHAPKATPRKPTANVAKSVAKVVRAWRAAGFEVQIPIKESERLRGVYTYAPCQGLF